MIQVGTTLIFRVGNGSTNAVVTSASFTTNAWHTVAAWHDSVNNTINIQIDNGAVSSTSYSGGAMDTTYPLTIGAHVGGSYVFNGRVDEVALYKRVLSANERDWLYNSGNGRAYVELFSNYTYGDAAHKHAVTSVSNTNFYQYDANGNQVTRTIGADTYNLKYDAEGRLIEVKKSNVVIAAFTYDGDGRRVKSVMGSETILFFGAHFEIKTGNQITKYYFAGSSRIAMRSYTIPYNNMTLTYLMGDHLGSTSLAVNAATGAVTETRYKAWGEVRYTTPNVTLPTRNTFTGQYSYISDDATDLGSSGFGLMFYNARWYDPSLGRMAQADTIVPGGVQGLDRYAYVNNSPLNYVDPSGHKPCPSCNTYRQRIRAHKLHQAWIEDILASAVSVSFLVPIPGCTGPVILGDTGCRKGAKVGMGAVVGDMSTIVTAAHTYTNTLQEIGTPTVLAIVNKDGTEIYIPMSEVELALGTDDQLTIHLKNSLPDKFVAPAEKGSGQSLRPGQVIYNAYMDSHGEFQVKQSLIVAVINGHYFFSNAPVPSEGNKNGLRLYGGDSGGGVFLNGQFVGIVAEASNYWFVPLAFFVPYP